MTSDDEVPEGEAGMARVIIGTDVTARVDRVGGHFDQIVHRGRETRSYVTDVDTLLCASTPCTVALPYGDYELKLSAVSDPTRASTATIRVRHRTEIVNHVLGMNRRSTTGTLGGVLSVIGSVVVGIGVGVGLVQAQEHRTAHTATDSTMPVLVGIGGTTLMTGDDGCKPDDPAGGGDTPMGAAFASARPLRNRTSLFAWRTRYVGARDVLSFGRETRTSLQPQKSYRSVITVVVM